MLLGVNANIMVIMMWGMVGGGHVYGKLCTCNPGQNLLRQVNSRNDSIFKIPNSPPYPPISMLNLAQFCCQNPKTFPKKFIWAERGFFNEK